MNKTTIKNFAIWARNKLIADISYKAGLLGITEKGIKSPLPQSTQTVQFFDIGTKEPSSITGIEIQQRKKLVEEIERKAKQSDYATAYKNVIEEVAYTWFNRLIAIRFMEVNDYLPTRIRVLSSESIGKAEPDLVTHALEANLDYSAYEKDRIIQLKHENMLDELFRMLFIKQCNALNANLPELFEKTSDYTELLMNVSFTDKEGVVYHLVNDISEDDFNVSKEGQVEIIGWLYQYYNTEPKDDAFALLKKNVKITKERIPAATQLFTPDWIVRYMVENSLGRLWLEGHPNDDLKLNWKYYLDEVEQEQGVQKQLDKIREEYKAIKPEEIKVIDPAMGSGHILVYAFDVLMQIYESYGFSQRDAAKSIVENNLYGLDIDNRAYQLAYFAVMMKARQYNRRILNGEIKCHVYAIQESNAINRNHINLFGAELSDIEKNAAQMQLQSLLDTLIDAKEYGSLLNMGTYNWELLQKFVNTYNASGQMTIDTIGVENTKNDLDKLIKIAVIMAAKYDVVFTNPPYMAISNVSPKLNKYINDYYIGGKTDLFSAFIEKCIEFCDKQKYISMITMQSWMFLTSFKQLRSKILSYEIINMAHLGPRGFDEINGEVVQTTAFVINKQNTSGQYVGIYSRLINGNNEKEKEDIFLSRETISLNKKSNFNKIPQQLLAYWVGENTVNCFEADTLSMAFITREGMATADNDRFLRLWHEVDHTKITFDCNSSEEAITRNVIWVPYNKGGTTRDWYGNNDYVVYWRDNGHEIKNNIDPLTGRVRSHNYNGEFGFKEGLTWSAISSGSISVRYCKEGFLFDSKGAKGFSKSGYDIFWILGLLNSKVSMQFLQFISPTLDFKVGDIASLPLYFDNTSKERIIALVKENVKLMKHDWDAFETSWDFQCHPLVRKCSLVEEAYSIWQNECKVRFSQIKSNEISINEYFIDLYSLQDELSPEVDDEEITVRTADLAREVKSLISYSVGCMFGRYSLNKPGLVYADSGWDISKNSSFIPDKDNVIPITDEQYFEDDIVEIFVKWLISAYGNDTIERNLKFIANALGKKGANSRDIIRDYFLNDFFKDHCNAYSITGSGKRPIYWLFDSGKQNGFKALVYMHRYDENSIGNLRIDYLHKIHRIYENEITRMQDTIENSKNAREVTAATKRKEKLIKQLKETKEYDEKIAHLAFARTSIDLDDGVKVNYEKVQTDRDGKKLDVLAKI